MQLKGITLNDVSLGFCGLVVNAKLLLFYLKVLRRFPPVEISPFPVSSPLEAVAVH